MADDIVAELRDIAYERPENDAGWMLALADEIERMRARAETFEVSARQGCQAAIDEIERFTAENKHLLAEVVRLSALLHHIEEEARRG